MPVGWWRNHCAMSSNIFRSTLHEHLSVALETAKQHGVKALLMIDDYDEARALSERNPAGALGSLAELPDALRLIAQRAGLGATTRSFMGSLFAVHGSAPPRPPNII